MCIDPLSATALVLAADHGCGCGCGRRSRRNSCGCRGCDTQREMAADRQEEHREQEASERECCENMARQRAEERAQARDNGCGCSRAASDSDSCSCGVVRPGATSWSPSRPSRY